ncbi:hypothetical protein [Endozoicomonas sp. SCSIO W0465]|uniref:hypothetical protein n=1 Tax=Endozoicomonas sp. SCSIO W0465 TaxID=2918516 RepID=UPI0020760CEA|nr:hypothetical protein [Endozoicomonas sp. SCSIO W0465]USE39251.1 hypothetical protein MJO57_14460 [Endozoicomonas sp. SCSIO W0465]
MIVMYQLTETGVLRLSDLAYIPDCTDNFDWQEYQQWLKEGNKPLPMPVYIDNRIYITNGQARQQRIKREQQAKIKAEALALKKQVETLNTLVMNEV